jgi:L-2-hydroxyglutarate oxidase
VVPPQSDQFDGIIIGAGIVGLACAYQIHLQHPNIRLLIVDKESEVAQHQTGHNSGVLHSGIYYPPQSLKAHNCLRGKALMEEFCHREGIAYDICGKVIVAKQKKELPRLEHLYQRGLQNGLQVELISAEALKEIEPHVQGIQAIHVKKAGIVDYSEVCKRLLQILIDSKRHCFRHNFKVTNLHHHRQGVEVISESEIIKAKWGINAAGLYSDKLVELSGTPANYKIIPFRGEYYKLKPERRHLCQNLIYPVPDPSFPFLGVHLTRMIGGEIECGPNAVLAMAREGYTWKEWNVLELIECLLYPGFQKLASRHLKAGLEEMKRSFFKAAFTKSLQELVPEIQEQDLIKAPAGIRAQALESSGKLMDDFHFVSQKPWLHLCNVPSPAATSSLNIGLEVLKKLNQDGFLQER